MGGLMLKISLKLGYEASGFFVWKISTKGLKDGIRLWNDYIGDFFKPILIGWLSFFSVRSVVLVYNMTKNSEYI